MVHQTDINLTGILMTKTFADSESWEGGTNGLEVRSSVEGNVEFIHRMPNWQCNVSETLVIAPPMRSKHLPAGMPLPRDGELFRGDYCLWVEGDVHKASVLIGDTTHLSVGESTIPPSERSFVPELILACLDARVNKHSKLLLNIDLLSEIPRENLKQTVQSNGRVGTGEEWVIEVLAPEKALRNPVGTTDRILSVEEDKVWAKVDCFAEVLGDLIRSLRVHLVRYRRFSNFSSLINRPGMIVTLNMSDNNSRQLKYAPPVLTGKTRVRDFRFNASTLFRESPVTYETSDGTLLTETEPVVAAQLAEIRMARECSPGCRMPLRPASG